MASFITSIISGLMGGHAAGTAANDVIGAANAAGTSVMGAAQGGNQGISNATAAGQQSVLNSGQLAQELAQLQAALGQAGVSGAQQTAASLLNPYSAAGSSAAAQLAAGLQKGGDLNQNFTAADMQANDPGYQFRLQQGQQAVARAMAAAGGVQGGGAMKALNDYSQNAASAEYQNAFNRFTTTQQNRVSNLQNLANAGQAAGTTMGNQFLQASEYNAGLGENAAQYAGNAGMQTNEYQAGMGLSSSLAQAQMQNQAAQYAGNMQLTAGEAAATGVLGKQSAYNGMLSGIGGFGDTLLTGGFSGLMNGLQYGWNPSVPMPPTTGAGSGNGGVSGWGAL